MHRLTRILIFNAIIAVDAIPNQPDVTEILPDILDIRSFLRFVLMAYIYVKLNFSFLVGSNKVVSLYHRSCFVCLLSYVNAFRLDKVYGREYYRKWASLIGTLVLFG